jgi:hypothetical protein
VIRMVVGAAAASERHSVMVPWRTIFFAVNVSAALGMVVTIAGWLVASSAPDLSTLVVGCVLSAPFLTFVVAEWLLFARRVVRLERPLGIVPGIVGGLSLFAFFSNLGEAVVHHSSPGLLFWCVFGLACSSVAVYGSWCCWLRVRHRTLEVPRGFGVVRAAP